ncbi:MAG: response regulator transcription factor [Chloroflexota bacterium]|jgi:DNA-binding response OmpR family regulator
MPIREEESALSSTPRGSVLIIDDDDNLRSTLAMILQKAGYRVTTAENAESALNILKAGVYDLAFLDLKMPGMEGTELLVHLRELYPDMPVLILTAHASLDSSIHAVRFGARDYLIKPMSPQSVLERIEQVLDDKDHPRRRRELINQMQSILAELGETVVQKKDEPNDMLTDFLHADPMRFIRRGNFLLDLQSKRVTFVGQVIELSPTSFDYLVCLVRHAPNPVTYDTLIMESQGYHLDPTEAREMARWRVHELRKVIEEDPKNPKYVLTVRGFGYQIAG